MTYDLLTQFLPNLLIILTIFSIGVASPGPATLMILGTAMSQGRASAMALSLGVVAGSMFWACVAALGFVAAIKTSASLFMALKIAGGLYLFFLAFRSWRSALTPGKPLQAPGGSAVNFRSFFIRGLLLHLTNPKAPLVWLATLSVGLGDSAPTPFLMLAIGLCAVIAIAVFVGYAFVFSTPTAARFYISVRRPFDAVLGLLFGAAAIKILTSKVT